MDLSTIKPHSIEVAVKHPHTGVATGLVLEVVSEYDERVKAAQAAGRARIMTNGGMTPEIAQQNYDERVRAHVVGWRWEGDASWGGEKLKFSQANLAKVLANDTVREQVEASIDKKASFFA